jgi:hypothetical protein
MAALETFRCPKCARTIQVLGLTTKVQHRCAGARLAWVAFVRVDEPETVKP